MKVDAGEQEEQWLEGRVYQFGKMSSSIKGHHTSRGRGTYLLAGMGGGEDASPLSSLSLLPHAKDHICGKEWRRENKKSSLPYFFKRRKSLQLSISEKSWSKPYNSKGSCRIVLLPPTWVEILQLAGKGEATNFPPPFPLHCTPAFFTVSLLFLPIFGLRW